MSSPPTMAVTVMPIVIVNVAVAVFWIFGLPTLVSGTSTVKVELTTRLVGVPEMTPVDFEASRGLGMSQAQSSRCKGTATSCRQRIVLADERSTQGVRSDRQGWVGRTPPP